MQSLGRSPLGTAATHHNDVTTRSSIPIHFQQQISTELPDNPWLRHYYYYYLISLSFVPSLPYSFRYTPLGMNMDPQRLLIYIHKVDLELL